MSGLSRGMRVLLLGSLLLNVVLGVALVLLVPRLHDDGPRGRHVPPLPALFDPRALKEALPEARHGVLEAAMRSHREAIRARIGTLFDARRAVRAAIVAEPFDRDALDAAFARLREAETATAEEAQAMLGDVLSQSDVAERKRLADLMPRRGGHRREGRDTRERVDESASQASPSTDAPAPAR